jgi:hypothetical protein
MTLTVVGTSRDAISYYDGTSRDAITYYHDCDDDIVMTIGVATQQSFDSYTSQIFRLRTTKFVIEVILCQFERD